MEDTLHGRGDHFVLALDGDLVKRWQIDETTPLTFELDGHRRIVTAHPDPDREQKFRETMEDAHRKYGEMFRRLAQDD